MQRPDVSTDRVAKIANPVPPTEGETGSCPRYAFEELCDPVLALLASAPVDDEPVTEDDGRQIADGWEAYRGKGVILSPQAKDLGSNERDFN